jgi:hypothetical protein
MKGIVRLALLTGGLALVAGPPGAATGAGVGPPPGTAGTILAAGGAEARLAVRSGDPAPVAGRLGPGFSCRITAAPDGSLLFTDAAGTALFRRDATGSRPILYAGEEAPAGGRYASFCETAAGGDGSIAFHALLADGREVIDRFAPGAAAPEAVLVTGETVALRDGPATIATLLGPAIDGLGRVLAAADTLEGLAAVLAVVPAATPDVLLQTGDPVGEAGFTRAPVAPAANRSGVVAVIASRDDGVDVVAAVAPGAAPVVLFRATALPGQPYPSAAIAPPAINDSGQVAFLWSSLGSVRVQRAAAAGSATVAVPGSAAPGGGTFTEITEAPPLITPTGAVLFGAVRSNGRSGLYLTGATAPIAETTRTTLDAGTLTRVGIREGDPAAGLGADGAFHFAARATLASGVFSALSGTIRAEIRAGDPFEAARFASFLEGSIAILGGGPALAPGGWMIFDARVTGGARGLFRRDRDGGIETVAVDGDAAPEGGAFEGDSFAFHSIDASGEVAFVGAAAPAGVSPGGSPAGRALYVRPAGGGTMRVLGAGDPEPGGAGTVADLLPPSRLNRAGAIAVPAVLAGGDMVLYGWDGTALFRVAGPGDPAPGGRFVRLYTGSLFLGTAIPPALGDDGIVAFGGATDAGDVALYAARLAPGGGGTPQRLTGAGGEVEGGRLSPFEVQALDRDRAGRLALEAVFDDNYDFGLFLAAAGGTPARVAAPFDDLPGIGFVFSVAPRLALLGDGALAYDVLSFAGEEAILVRPAPATGGAAAGPAPADGDAPQDRVIAMTGETSPDGGLYVAFQRGTRATARIASDGAGTIAFAAAGGRGPEEIVLWGAPTNTPPIADAGPDRTAECAAPSGTAVTLYGSGSSDPDGDALTYRWTGPFGSAEGARPTVTLPLGTSIITLVVNDGQDDSPADTVTITVRDTEPPRIAVSASPALLWPPDGRMVDVGFGVTVSDRCDPTPAVALDAVTIEDAPGGRPGPGFSGAALGADDRVLALRADRSGAGAGRAYLVVYRVADASGNGASASATVLVPHDQRR